ncbi:MAG: hypothetical protein ABR599_06340 [Gemmatimonadota bacterium]
MLRKTFSALTVVLAGALFLWTPHPGAAGISGVPPGQDDGLLMIVDVTEVPLELAGPGIAPATAVSLLSGQVVVSLKDGAARIEAVNLYGGSVPTPQGETGPIFLTLHKPFGGTSAFDPQGPEVDVSAEFEGFFFYPLLERRLGVETLFDFTVQPRDIVGATFTYQGRFNPTTAHFEGLGALRFTVTGSQLDIFRRATTTGFFTAVSFEPLLLAPQNVWEICVEFVFETRADRAAWPAETVEQMLDRANEIFQACGIRVRSKLRDENCIEVVLKARSAAGGGGLCEGKGAAANAKVTMGANVVADCAARGVTTTPGQVLAHELGHGLNLPQAPRTGNLMDDCAPSGTLTADECKEAQSKAKKIKTPRLEAQGAQRASRTRHQVIGQAFELRNATGRDADDLRIKFRRPANVWVTQTAFKDVAGESTNTLDFGRGTVANGATASMTFRSFAGTPASWPENSIESCVWTRGGRPIGNCVVTEGS